VDTRQCPGLTPGQCHGRPVGIANDVQQARARQERQVGRRAPGIPSVRIEGQDRHIDQPLVAFAQPFRHRLGPAQQDVGPIDQRSQRRVVQRQALDPFAPPRHRDLGCIADRIGPFDLHHIRA
jgi:hypothetical protein